MGLAVAFVERINQEGHRSEDLHTTLRDEYEPVCT